MTFHARPHNQIQGWLTPEDLSRAKSLAPKCRLRQIAREIGEIMGLDASDILSKQRTAPLVRARHLAWFIAHREGMSYAEIARRHGTDHSTVLQGVRKEALAREVEA